MANTPRIALVEDNADNRLLICVLLEELYEIDTYESGLEALQGLTSSRPDLVLMDISLPGMDGVEVLSQIRANEALRGLPVLALTAHSMLGDRERFSNAGFDDYITKPIVDVGLLLGAIARWIPNGCAA